MDLTSVRDSQLLGQAEEKDAVICLVLKKEYCDIDESNDNRLLWKSHVEKIIKSGTLARLVQQLAPPHGEEIDHSYRTSFLAVYRTFATPTELLQELLEWFKKLELESKEQIVKESTETRTTLRSVLSFIRLWLEKYITDFNNPPSYDLLTALEQFLTDRTSIPLVSTEASELLRHVLEVRQKLMSGDLVPVNEVSEERAIDDFYDWLNFPPVQIAWDLTALDAAMFGSLVPHECLHYIRKQTDSSSTIYRTIEHFNKIIHLVITTVLQPSINCLNIGSSRVSTSLDRELSSLDSSSFCDSSINGDESETSDSSSRPDSCASPHSKSSSHTQRGRSISRWIDIAQQCRLLKNFSSLKAIVFGLQSSSVSRLTLSWANVSNERQSIFRELLDLFSSESNFQIFREVVNKEATGKRADVSSPHKKNRSPKSPGPSNNGSSLLASSSVAAADANNVVIGIVPYLGTFLSDLTMLHNALPDKNKDGQINFEKRRKEFEILAKISLFQTASSKYNLPKNPSLYNWIYHTPLLSENESYKLSMDLEPVLLSPTVKSSSPICEALIRRSLRLIRNTTTPNNKKSSGLSVPTDSRLRKSFDLDADEDSSSLDMGGMYRSNSCFELNDHIVVRISVKGQEISCNYKSIYLSKSDRTSKVIQSGLEKHGLSVEDFNKYQLSQKLGGKGELSLIPPGACVYYALDTKVQPNLFLQLKTS